jgi:hypothetical protein
MPNMSTMFHRQVALVAHQGGWDEVLLVAGPIVIIIAVLAVAKRRVDAIDHGDEHTAPRGS